MATFCSPNVNSLRDMGVTEGLKSARGSGRTHTDQRVTRGLFEQVFSQHWVVTGNELHRWGCYRATVTQFAQLLLVVLPLATKAAPWGLTGA